MNGNVLIAYFSHSGNTRKIAELIHEEVGGTIYELQPVERYPNAYNAVVDQAKKEINAGYLPPLKSSLDGVDAYDTMIIGSPNWWSTIAPPMSTFLKTHAMAGKPILPFCTHGGGGSGHIEADIQKMCPQATMLPILAIYGGGTGKIQDEIAAWLRRAGLLQ